MGRRREDPSSRGRTDHVVHAAGIGSGKFGFPFWNLDPADWERVLRVNLVGAVNVAHAFAPGMAAAGSGTFLFVASVLRRAFFFRSARRPTRLTAPRRPA